MARRLLFFRSQVNHFLAERSRQNPQWRIEKSCGRQYLHSGAAWSSKATMRPTSRSL
jgi:hypothetical protein